MMSMKKYTINEVAPPPPSTSQPLEHMLNVIDHQHESDKEEKRLDAKIEALRQAVSILETRITLVKEMCDNMSEQTMTIETGCSKLGEIADYITDLKQQIESMVIPAKITPNSFEEVKKHVNSLIQQANQMLEQYRLQQREVHL